MRPGNINKALREVVARRFQREILLAAESLAAGQSADAIVTEFVRIGRGDEGDRREVATEIVRQALAQMESLVARKH
jgi:hypothetical protein